MSLVTCPQDVHVPTGGNSESHGGCLFWFSHVLRESFSKFTKSKTNAPQLISSAAQEGVVNGTSNQSQITAQNNAQARISPEESNIFFDCSEESYLRQKDLERKNECNNFPTIMSDDDEDICAICLDGYDLYNPKITGQCSHHFHLSCIYEWKERSEHCALCMKVMVFEE